MAVKQQDFTRSLKIYERAFALAIPAPPGYYYITDEDGEVYLFGDYQGDGGNPITCYFRTKKLDFSDQFPELKDKWTSIDSVKVRYKDLSSSTPITVYISDDGGVTWVSRTRLLGTGDKKVKEAEFHFLDKENITSQFFTLKIECVSSTHKFEIHGIKINGYVMGDYFETS